MWKLVVTQRKRQMTGFYLVQTSKELLTSVRKKEVKLVTVTQNQTGREAAQRKEARRWWDGGENTTNRKEKERNNKRRGKSSISCASS